MSTAAWVGAWLAIAGAALLGVETAAAALLVARARRRARAFSEWQQAELVPIRAALSRLGLARAERETLFGPYRRIWRWYRHPLTRAYAESRKRRRGRP